MEKVCNKIQETVGFLSHFLPLANSHMVEFFSKNLWDAHVPSNLKSEFLGKQMKSGNVVDLFIENMHSSDTELGKFILSCSAVSLEKNELIVNSDFFRNPFGRKEFLNIDCTKIDRFMSEKKVHEVKKMSDVVADLVSVTNATHIIDIGDGKGYLSSYLSLKYNFKVLGLDASSLVTQGAAKRAHKLEKQWKSACKKLQSSCEEYSNEIISSGNNDSDRNNESYKQVTKFISFDTDLRHFLTESFPESHSHQFGLVGLHTCGNLSPICLVQFVNNKGHIPFLLNVGCCYHLLEEEDSQYQTFPLSSYLKQANFKLGRNARMLSLQAPSRIFTSKKIPDSLMFRAVFEDLIEDRLGICIGKEKEVGRIGSKCASFVDYSRKALKKLEIDIVISDVELNEFFGRYSSSRQLLEFYFMMRVVLAPVIENIVLLDRLLFLLENNIKQCYIVKLFDSYVSPRCYSIVALQD